MALSNIDLTIEDIESFKAKPSDDELKFGSQFTDRMLFREYKEGKWQVGKIMPFQNFSLSPAAQVFHYGQEIFEGLKAFTQKDGSKVVFRPDENAKRFNLSAERMVMPTLDEDYFVESVMKLVSLEKDWIPKRRGTALYIRPTMIATDAILGVKPSSEYYFYTILSPSGPYFSEGFAPTKIKVEDYYVRAVRGGTGGVKSGGNYGGSLLAAENAKKRRILSSSLVRCHRT